jgi:hypothetical protein
MYFTSESWFSYAAWSINGKWLNCEVVLTVKFIETLIDSGMEDGRILVRTRGMKGSDC